MCCLLLQLSDGMKVVPTATLRFPSSRLNFVLDNRLFHWRIATDVISLAGKVMQYLTLQFSVKADVCLSATLVNHWAIKRLSMVRYTSTGCSVRGQRWSLAPVTNAQSLTARLSHTHTHKHAVATVVRRHPRG